MSHAEITIPSTAVHIHQRVWFTYGDQIICNTLSIFDRLRITAAHKKLAIFIKLQTTFVIPGESKMKPPYWDMVE